MKNTKRSTEKRTATVLIAFAIFACYLLFNIFRLDYILYDYYSKKAYDQVTVSSTLNAERGSIYDSNMNLLAASNTVWRIFISTKEIKKAQKESGIDYAEIISQGLAPILSLSAETIARKITTTNLLDVTLKNNANEQTYGKTIEFIDKYSLEKLIFTESRSSRYYPCGTLAAHVLGFTGSDNQGLYGLEYYYESELSGEDGYYVYAKDANGNELDTEYSDYFPATNGHSLITTLDSYVQEQLEAVLERAEKNHSADNRVTGIVMNTSTGAILAMATTGAFDPNTPFELDKLSTKKLLESGYDEGSEEYKKYKTELMQTMWSNKAVSETYEPGSTFKIITVAAALDAGAVHATDTFSCPGYRNVGGWRIRCHKTAGHGSGFNLAYGLQMSCNPCMIEVSERLGAEKFYEYVKKFGLTEKTGIDLPSEAGTIFHQPQNIGPTELATASFGQRFKVSVIGQLAAIATVANGGKAVTPYVVEKIVDSNGNTVFLHTEEAKENIIKPEVAESVSKILIDGVNGDGGAKNAGVSGYDIAAKTGTSQKFDVLDSSGNSYLRIGSTVAYSLDGDSGVATIIVVDEPQSTVKYGSVVAAPYVSELMEKLLPYLEFAKKGEQANVKTENYVGLSVKSAKELLAQKKLDFEVLGDGDRVIAQMPEAGEIMTYPVSKMTLYTDGASSGYVTVPKLEGKNLSDAIRIAAERGLNIRLSGICSTSPSADDVICMQSLTAGEKVKKGSVIILRAIKTDHED